MLSGSTTANRYLVPVGGGVAESVEASTCTGYGSVRAAVSLVVTEPEMSVSWLGSNVVVCGPVEGGGRRLGQVGTADRVAEVSPAFMSECRHARRGRGHRKG